METYTAMRAFADSWGLLAMLLFFLGVCLRLLSPRARRDAQDAAQIPFRDPDAYDRNALDRAEKDA
ncbi:cbb3-type cytochrome c oxidase subunit 3 [Rubrimonas cliftonensis]|uniref:Cytochrome c oxidase cbb3-type subunit 4 n=1 Tax=Rubrimonas cliftonensis TaxID=89524 RepID=A0A1H4DJZ7_9RHOB|nr:cbb3-type cytochrome c oxidase subunit 3 [Rubrimonas cliftonensis]SEA72809.1 cytochrome c oxidase cbb3-type subunit 4 [Rubrimonas cliftonensis]